MSTIKLIVQEKQLSMIFEYMAFSTQSSVEWKNAILKFQSQLSNFPELHEFR